MNQKPPSDPSGPKVPPQVARPVDKSQIQQFVTTIKNAEQQVGEHIISALQHPGTVAVLTTAVVGPDGQQRVISAALDPQKLKLVQEILTDAQNERVEEEPCVGFHCLVTPKEPAEAEEPDSSTDPPSGS